MKTAFYPGSFDPATNGHLDILGRALALADKVIVAIGIHPAKKGLFTFEERKAILVKSANAAFGDKANAMSVISFEGLVVDAAKLHGASILIRGLRDATDFDYEMQMAGMNGVMAPDIQTVFFASFARNAADYRHIGTADRCHGWRYFGFCAKSRSRSPEEPLQSLN